MIDKMGLYQGKRKDNGKLAYGYYSNLGNRPRIIHDHPELLKGDKKQ